MKNGYIWLPYEKYPSCQTTFYNSLDRGAREGKHIVCRLKKRYDLTSVPKKVELTVTADTSYLLILNDKDLLRGPAYSGGDFLNNDKVRGDFYSYKIEAAATEPYLDFEAYVRLTPYHICEYSKGQGGFYLNADITLDGGEKITLTSDESWEISLLNSYTYPHYFDGKRENDAPVFAEVKNDIWNSEVAPVPPCEMKNHDVISFLLPGGKSDFKRVEYERVYAGFLKVKSFSENVRVRIKSFENDVINTEFDCYFKVPDTYYSLELLSTGGFEIEVINEGDKSASCDVIFDESYFPIYKCAKITVDDPELNELTDICRHNLKYCRQGHHLDSPLHCEPLACVGDYYIEMLMTQFSYGDTSLTEFDLIRIAKTMEENGGRLFHTTYSLIYVKMLYECYMINGKESLLSRCKLSLDLLFGLFKTYIGENGIIETPPDYMFIDWLFPDGISTHHPPKALGQTCLNMFYYGALIYGAKIYEVLGKSNTAKELSLSAEKLKSAILSILYDEGKGLFFEGLNTETPEELIYQYMPRNVKKRYFRRHANILACYFGILQDEAGRELLDKIYENDSLGEVQPYFMHFWLGAVYNLGYREKYTLPLLKGWREALKKCKKGLPEGFYPPEPTYKFDYSHAWAGTPLYSLPLALTGLEILEAGYKKIRLTPSLLSLNFARVEIPTEGGFITVEGEKGKEIKITLPKGVELIK